MDEGIEYEYWMVKEGMRRRMYKGCDGRGGV